MLDYEFMRNALAAGLLVSLAVGFVGTFVVLNRIVFLAGGIAHASYGGVGLGYLLGVSPVLGAFGFAVASAATLGVLHRRAKDRTDTLIGALWATGMSLGVVFLDLSDGYKTDLMSYLFGSILAVPRNDLWLLAGLDAALVVTALALFPHLVAVSFDPDHAATSGLPVGVILLVLHVAVAVTVVMLMRVVGLVLVVALLAVPTAVAAHLTHRIRVLIPLTGACALVFIWTGLVLAYAANLTSGATIVLVAVTGYALVVGIGSIVRRRSSASRAVPVPQAGGPSLG